MRHYWVDPNNTTDIQGPYYVGRAVVLEDGTKVTGNLRGHAPEINMYQAAEDNTPVPQYHTFDTTLVSLALVGPAQQISSYVQEDASGAYVPFTIDQLLEAKEAELEVHVEDVFFSSFKMEGLGGVFFWINASAKSRAYRTDVDAFYQWQPPQDDDMLLKTSPGAEVVVGNSGKTWRDIPVWIIRVDNLNEIRTKIDKDEWTTLKEAQGRFSIDVAYAGDEVQSVLEFHHAQNDWTALAAVDVTANPTNNPWPEHNMEVFNGASF